LAFQLENMLMVLAVWQRSAKHPRRQREIVALSKLNWQAHAQSASRF
jgi:hypothetical protein